MFLCTCVSLVCTYVRVHLVAAALELGSGYEARKTEVRAAWDPRGPTELPGDHISCPFPAAFSLHVAQGPHLSSVSFLSDFSLCVRVMPPSSMPLRTLCVHVIFWVPPCSPSPRPSS